MRKLNKIILVIVLFFAVGQGFGQCNWSVYATPACGISCTGTITIQGTGGTPPISATIDGGPPFVSNSLPFIITGICPGTHFVHVQDNSGGACILDTIFTTLIDSITFQNVMLPVLCPGECAQIVGNVSGGCAPYTFLWSNGATTPTILVCVPGNYSLTVTDGCGCSATQTYTVGLDPCCIPDTSSYAVVCERSTYTFTAPLHAGSIYQWSVTGDSIYTINNNSITVTWHSITTAYQLANITYTEFLVNGTQSTHSILYYITRAPRINLTSSPVSVNHEINICKGQTISFINQTGNADNYKWNFGDGYTTTVQDASHAYADAGTYVIHFEASTNCGCSAVDSFLVNVTNSTGPDIECRSLVCENDTAVYSTSAVCNNYYWNVTGGTIISAQPYSNNIQVVWNNTSSNGLVSLYTGNCLGQCSDTAFLNIPVIAANSTIAGEDTVCYYGSYSYAVPFVAATYYNWTLTPANVGTISGYGTNQISVEFSGAATSCTLNVTYQNSFLGCSGSGSLDITIAYPVTFYGDDVVCKNDSATVYASLSGYLGLFSYTVIDPAGAVAVQNAQQGSFNILCPDSGYYYVYAQPATGALYCKLADTLKIHCVTTESMDSITGAQNICLGKSYSYTAYGAVADHMIHWGAIGGAINGAQGINKTTCNVTWTGAAPHMVYCLQQDVYGNNCLSDTIFYSVNEVSSATVIGPSVVCTNGIYNYDVIVADIPDAYYEWTVTTSLASVKTGQGTKQIEVEFHNASGTAIVQCTLMHCNTIVAIKSNIMVTAPAPAVIIPSIPVFCSGSSIAIESDSALSYQWTDSLNTVVGNTQIVNLSQGGSYTLTTIDSNQCRSILNFYVTEDPTPVALLSSPSANVFCIPTPVNVTLYAATNPDYTYQWLNNGLPVPSGTSPILNTTQTGFYQVLITNGFGCTAISNGFPVSSIICPPPDLCTTGETIVANVTNDFCNPIEFLGFASAGVSNPSWNFGDPSSGINNTSTLTNPTHVYSMPGYYYASYSGTVVNLTPPPPTCSLIDLALVTVLGSCDFESEPACAGVPTQFIDLSLTLPGITISSYSWDFGDSYSSALQSPQHVYQNAGVYTVTLTITYSTCTTVASHTVTIPGASVAFTTSPSPTCKGTPVGFTFSNNGASPIIDQLWNFGDGISSLNLSPVRAYDSSGTFTAVLIVTDSKGCTDTVSQNLFVNPSPVAGIITPPGPINECSYTSIVLNAPAGSSYLWSNGSTIQSISANGTGNYFVEVTDANNCIYTTQPVEVTITQPPHADIRGNSDVCYGSGVSLTASIGNSLVYEWHQLPANNIVSVTNSFNFPWTTSPGTYPVYLIETDNTTNCSDTSDILQVIIHASPNSPVITSVPTGFLCACNSTMLEVSNPITNGIYLWSNGQLINYDNLNNPQINVSLPGDYSVIVTNESGCKASSNTVTIHPPVDFSPMISGCYELCDTITHTLQAIQCPDGTGEWLDISQQPAVVVSTNSFYTVTQSGIYVYVCISPNCSDTSESINIAIEHCCPIEPPQPILTYLNDTIFSSVTNGSYIYAWYLNNQLIIGGNLTYLLSIGDGCYTLTITDAFGCNTSSNTLCFVTTNVIETIHSEGVIVFPNPASDMLKFRSSTDKRTHLQIADINGKIVLEKDFIRDTNISISKFAEGNYFYSTFEGDRNLNTGKFVIVR